MKYRKKPVVVDAYQFSNRVGPDDRPEWLLVAVRMGVVKFVRGNEEAPHLLIHTLEGTMRADPGDWIIKGVKGELYPCKPGIFEATYEKADE